MIQIPKKKKKIVKMHRIAIQNINIFELKNTVQSNPNHFQGNIQF